MMRVDDLRALAEELDTAPRQGAAEDVPEGARFVVVSDTAMRAIATRIRAAIGEGSLRGRGHRAACASLDVAGARRACDCGAES